MLHIVAILRVLASLVITFGIVASQSASGADDASRDNARYTALVLAVTKNTGRAHAVRGMNACTILALHDTASIDDIGLLQRMLDDPDRIVALTAVHVLSIMGNAGAVALRAGISGKNRAEREQAIQDAANTVETIVRYRRSGTCRIRK